MTEVQVYDGEGITARILESEITDLIMKAYPTELPERTKEWLRRQVNSHLDDILNDRQQGIIEEEYEEDPDPYNMKEFERHFGLEPDVVGIAVKGNKIAHSSNHVEDFVDTESPKRMDWSRLTKEQLAELEAAIGPVNIEESNDSSPSV